LGIEVEERFVGAQTLSPIYLETARLLTRIAPLVFAENVFALKGGTAINLFVRDMPRLSVDLDLVFVDHRAGREEAIVSINKAIKSAAERLKKYGYQTRTVPAVHTGETKLFVRKGRVEVKVEVNFVMRGTAYPVRPASLRSQAKDILQADLELPLVALEDLYGSKLVAALDRQHPRDLFDVMELLRHEGITPGIRRGFVVYLACHNRPFHEVLSPNLRDISVEYESTFKGLTAEPVKLETLLAARQTMISDLNASLDVNERAFLLSIARNQPNWALLSIEHLDQLPGIRWKLKNLERLAKESPKKFNSQAQALERLLEMRDH